MLRKVVTISSLIVAILALLASVLCGETPSINSKGKIFRIGFFEAGDHAPHSAMRSAFRTQIERIVPAEMILVFPANGFYTAGWSRDSCRFLARKLASQESIDIICTFGPWVVEDLIAAGCTKPIVAMYRADPVLEGLIGSNGRPIYKNVTVDVFPQRVEKDLATLASNVPIKKLGVLYFPSGDEGSRVLAFLDTLGRALGFEVVGANAQNAVGTFAFFKAYGELGSKVDAVYAPFLWDMGGDKLRSFYERLAGDGVPVFSSEGRFSVEHGAILSRANITVDAQAWFDAWKALRILKGESPADLPISYPDDPTMMVNEGVFQRLKLALSEDVVTESEAIPAPISEDAPRYTLSDAFLRALAQNPGRLAVSERLQAAAAEASRAWSQYLPQVTGRVAAYHFDDHAVENDFLETKNGRFTGSVTLEQKLFSLSAIRSIQVESAKRKLADISSVQDSLDITLAVTSAYFDCLKAEELVSSAIQSRRAVTHCLEMARVGAFVAGDSRAIERLRSEQLMGSSRLLELRQLRWMAQVMFNSLLNQAGDTPFSLDSAGFGSKECSAEQYVLWRMMRTGLSQTTARDYLISQAMADNPRLCYARQEINIRTLQLASNSARYAPTLSLKSAYDFTDRLRDNPPSFVERDFSWSVGVNLELPLFVGGDRHKERRQLKSFMNASEYQRDQIALEVMRDVSVETNNLMSALRKSKLLEEAIGSQNAQLELAVGEFVSGKSGLLEVLDAIRSAHDVSEQLTDAKFGYWQSSAKLLHSIGWPMPSSKLTPGRVIATRLAESGLMRR